jgi:CheY-like chemotaxis protein
MAKKHELEIILAENGAIALDLVKMHTPGFVLLDVSMPKLSGIECGREIKEVSRSIHIALISSVHSLSLQDAAKRGRIELFTVASVANVKVPEFVEAMLNRKELPPDASEEIEREVLSKRSTQRFPFEGEVQYQIGTDWQSGVFVNVSQDGLLFQSKDSVPEGTKLVISWMDQGKKSIEIPAIAVRHIASNHPQYPYMIGVQFLKVSAALDQKIAELSDDIDIFQESTAVELDLDLIAELLNERGTYFRDMFHGGKVPLFVELAITDIVEHERTSFQKNDDYSRCLQELVSSKILCQMVQATLEQIKALKVPGKTYSTRLVTIMSELLEKVEYAEGDSDRLVKQSIQENKPTDRHQINESNNRLYQSKAALLKVFCGQIQDEDIHDSHQAALEEIRKINKQLTSYQDHLDEMAKDEEKERKQSSITRVIKPVEKQEPGAAAPVKKSKLTFDVQQQVKKTHYIPFIALFILLMMSIPWMESMMKVYFIRDDIKLLIEPESVKRTDQGALKISITKEAWDKLNDESHDAFLDQIEVYLTRKKLHQAKIVDGDRLIAAVYSSIYNQYPGYLRNVFLDADTDTDQSADPVIVETPMDEPAAPMVQKKVDSAVKVAPKKAAPKKAIKAQTKKPAKLKASTKATRNKNKKPPAPAKKK